MSELTYEKTTTVTETRKMTGPEAELLTDLYCKIWTEACYDADCEATQKYARTLLPSIQKLNESLKFKT